MPSQPPTHVVTGSFGFLGRFITHRLLAQKFPVLTLTNHPHRPNPFPSPIPCLPFDFDRPARLAAHLEGAHTVFNTYWVRFPHRGASHGQAVANTQNLIRAAQQAGVQRFVHISITNPSLDSPLPYFRGKAILEQTLQASGLSYAIIRPTVLFGYGDILLNNIAWLLRHLPAFGVFGSGDYRIQPVHVEDVASLAVSLAQSSDNVVVDAVGPETFSYLELVRLIRRALGVRRPIVHVTQRQALFVARLLGWILRDVVITREEIIGLSSDLLVSNAPPTCSTHLTEWLEEHASSMGRHYASEVARHFDGGQEGESGRVEGGAHVGRLAPTA